MQYLKAVSYGVLISASVLLNISFATTRKKPVIIDTDIGGFNDDTVAIGVALSHPKLDVRLIVTASGDTISRARVLAKYLEAVGRHDIPVGIGEPTEQPGEHFLFDWASDFALSDYKGKIYKDGIKAMGEMLLDSDKSFDIIATAPMTNFPRLLKEYPSAVQKASIKTMAGSIYKGYDNSSGPTAEYNVKFCPSCAGEVFSAGWDVSLIPLDTSGVVELSKETYFYALESLKISTLVIFEMEQFSVAMQGTVSQGNYSSVWYDPVATYLTVMSQNPRFLSMVDLRLKVTKDGYTVVDKTLGHLVHVALTWKDKGLEEYKLWLAKILY